jgi:hypothetical protein
MNKKVIFCDLNIETIQILSYLKLQGSLNNFQIQKGSSEVTKNHKKLKKGTNYVQKSSFVALKAILTAVFCLLFRQNFSLYILKKSALV